MATTYQQFYTQYDEAIRAGADAAMNAGIAWSASLLPAILLPVIVVCGFLLATGQMGMGVATRYGWRVILLVWLTTGAAYAPYVRDMVVDTIPNEWASALHGSVNNRLTAAEQFDVVDDAAGNFTSRVLGQATGPFQIGNATAAWLARAFQKLFLAAIFFVWVSIRMLSYMAIAIGAFMLVLIPFDSTRGWVMGMFGKMAGLLIWQLAASILLKIMLGGMMVYLRGIIANSSGYSIEQQVDVLLNIAVFFFGLFVLFLMVPSVVSVVSGSSAGAVIAQGAMFNAARSMTNAGNAISRVAHSMRNRK